MAAQCESALSRAVVHSQSDGDFPLVVRFAKPGPSAISAFDPERTVFPIRARNRACRSLFTLARTARAGYFCK
jgi:hypothetical protein